MDARLKEFLQFIRLNRNASVHTARAYASDLSQFLDHVAQTSGTPRAKLKAGQLDRLALRGFMAGLHKRGLSPASAARKLSTRRRTTLRSAAATGRSSSCFTRRACGSASSPASMWTM
jgi:site-specific recombinase XerC